MIQLLHTQITKICFFRSSKSDILRCSREVFVCYFKTESAQENRLKDYWLRIECRAKEGSKS